MGLAGFGLLLIGLTGGLFWANTITKTRAPESTSTTPTNPKTIVVAGDIACETGRVKSALECRHGDTAELAASLNPDAVLTVGDNQYPKGELKFYQESYDETWGKLKSITYPTPGNHEYYTADASGYYDYFGDRAGERGKGYYSYKIGDWLMLALNSEIDVSAGSPQLAWLEQELKSNKNTCSLAYWHKSRFSTSEHGDNPQYDALWKLLYANNVDVVANGHSHGYERFIPLNPDGNPDTNKGIVQFVSGMGGNFPQGLKSATSNLATRQNHAFGVLKLTLYPKSAHYEFVPIPSQQTFSDSGIVACH